jgi:hypothetical protein
MRIIVLIATAILLGSVTLGASECEASTEKDIAKEVAGSENATAVPIIQVTAASILAAYEDNAIAADQKYKDKILDISGPIDDFGEDIMGTKYLTLSDSSEYSFETIRCMFSDEHVNQLATLKKGQTITARGKSDGKLIINVVIRGCSIVKP